MFLYAQSDGVQDSLEVRTKKLFFTLFFQEFTEISSPVVDGEAAALQCFHFWFQIDGFFDGAKNESLAVAQISEGDGVPDKELWLQQSATLDWTEVRGIIRMLPPGPNGDSRSTAGGWKLRWVEDDHARKETRKYDGLHSCR